MGRGKSGKGEEGRGGASGLRLKVGRVQDVVLNPGLIVGLKFIQSGGKGWCCDGGEIKCPPARLTHNAAQHRA